MPLYLAYNNAEQMDGFGAQLLRIMGIYSTARKLGCGYIHMPIQDVIEEFSHGINNEDELGHLVERVNEFFELPSDNPPPFFHKIFVTYNLSRKQLFKFFLRYQFSRKNVLVKITLPFGVVDNFPHWYKMAVDSIYSRKKQIFEQHIRNDTVVHLRLGYGQHHPIANTVSPRFLPINYYGDLLNAISSNVEEFKRQLIVVHTDSPISAKVWRPTKKALDQCVAFGENVVDGSVEVYSKDYTLYFQALGWNSIDYRSCDDFLSTFLDMACAERLLMSRSAFSYIAALFNKKEVIWPANHGHARLPSWKSSLDFGIGSQYELTPG